MASWHWLIQARVDERAAENIGRAPGLVGCEDRIPKAAPGTPFDLPARHERGHHGPDADPESDRHGVLADREQSEAGAGPESEDHHPLRQATLRLHGLVADQPRLQHAHRAVW